MPRPHPPSVDQGVIAFLWAVLCGCIIYLFLVGIGESHAFSIVITLLAFAAIWLFIRLRGEDRPRV